MIVPWLLGLSTWAQAPLTWTLIAINVFFFVLFQDVPSSRKSQSLLTEQNLRQTGMYYHQYLQLVSGEQTKEITGGSNRAESLPDQKNLLALGSRALRDKSFLDALSYLRFSGDQVQQEQWRSLVNDLRDDLKRRNLSRFGFTSETQGVFAWITYQFMHSGFLHLLGNMLMLLIFGAAVERFLGGFYLLGLFLLSGAGGAFFYHFFTSPSLAPMVGASGALSGLIGFYALVEPKKNVSFFYFISPFPGHYGWIFLPTLFLLPLSFASDLAAFWATPQELGSAIAYLAHFGGACTGLAVGAIFLALVWLRRRWGKASPEGVLSNATWFHKVF